MSFNETGGIKSRGLQRALGWVFREGGRRYSHRSPPLSLRGRGISQNKDSGCLDSMLGQEAWSPALQAPGPGKSEVTGGLRAKVKVKLSESSGKKAFTLHSRIQHVTSL